MNEARRFRAVGVFKALGGIRARDGYLCRCPVPSHGKGKGDRHPSLSVRDGDYRLLVHCFAGCDAASVEAELVRRDLSQPYSGPLPAAAPAPPKTTTADALALWRAGLPVPGSLAADYLAGRRLPPDLPTLRFLPRYRYGRRTYPALVAALQQAERSIVSVQLTLLHPTRPEKAPVRDPRVIIGPSRGLALRLAPAAETLGLAEGYETGHAAMLRFGVPTWCSLGAARLPFVELPPAVKRLSVFADPDNGGRLGAQKTVTAHPDHEVIVHYPPDQRDFAQWWQDDPTCLPLPFP